MASDAKAQSLRKGAASPQGEGASTQQDKSGRSPEDRRRRQDADDGLGRGGGPHDSEGDRGRDGDSQREKDKQLSRPSSQKHRDKQNTALQHILATRRSRDEKNKQADRGDAPGSTQRTVRADSHPRERDASEEGEVSDSSDGRSSDSDASDASGEGEKEKAGRKTLSDRWAAEKSRSGREKELSDRGGSKRGAERSESERESKRVIGMDTDDGWGDAPVRREGSDIEEDRLFVEEKRDLTPQNEITKKKMAKVSEFLTLESMMAVWLGRKKLEHIMEHPKGQEYARDAYVRLSDGLGHPPGGVFSSSSHQANEVNGSVAIIVNVVMGDNNKIKEIVVVDKNGDERTHMLDDVCSTRYTASEIEEWKLKLLAGPSRASTAAEAEAITEKLLNMKQAIKQKANHLKSCTFTSDVVNVILQKKNKERKGSFTGLGLKELFDIKVEREGQINNLSAGDPRRKQLQDELHEIQDILHKTKTLTQRPIGTQPTIPGARSSLPSSMGGGRGGLSHHAVSGGGGFIVGKGVGLVGKEGKKGRGGDEGDLVKGVVGRPLDQRNGLLGGEVLDKHPIEQKRYIKDLISWCKSCDHLNHSLDRCAPHLCEITDKDSVINGIDDVSMSDDLTHASNWSIPDRFQAQTLGEYLSHQAAE
eukprot:GHVN01091843.1.p1 GENE.GHVN01091843.1~~GHVN01091843.1.p1  ORF type:complete len:647 (+),score=182.87 GHVN01091843.1:1493-3433(+)